MNTRRKKIEAIAIAAIMVVSVFAGILPTASATISDLVWTDGNDDVLFCNETVTITWTDDENVSTYYGLSNNTAPFYQPFLSGSIGYIGGAYNFRFLLDNYTKIWGTPNATEALLFGVNGGTGVTWTNESQIKKQIPMNNYSITLDASNLLVGTIKDNFIAGINTSGISGESLRANAFTDGGITSNCTGFTVNELNMSTTTGNGTVNATIGDTAGLYWVNVTTGNATRVEYFNVADITTNVTKVRAGATTSNQSLCYLNLTGSLTNIVDYSVLVNISIDTSITGRTTDRLLDNATKGAVTTINVTLLSGHWNWTQDATLNHYGNYSDPINITTTGSTAGWGQLIIDTNVTGGTDGKKWYVPYEVVSTTTNITCDVSSPYTDRPQWARVGDNITLSTWNFTAGGQIWANISYQNESNDWVFVENISIVPDGIYGTNTTTWNTNATWQTWYPFRTGHNPQNFTINVSDVVSGGSNYTLSYVELYDYMVTSTDVTDYAAINTTFNVTVNSSMRNGTVIYFNMTSTDPEGNTVIINNTAELMINSTGADGTAYNATTYNSSVVLPDYNTSYGTDYVNLTGTVGIVDTTYRFWGTNGVGTKVLTIKANDTAWSDTTTVTLRDEIIIDSRPSIVVPGQNATIRGRVLRQAGTIINCTESGVNYDNTHGTITTAYNATTGYSNFTVNWTTVVVGTTTPLEEGAYTLYLNDTFVKTSSVVIQLGAATMTYTVSPDSASPDDIVWFNGTTNFDIGTRLNASITKDGTVITNGTWNNNLSALVESDDVLNQFRLWWLPRNNATNISNVFTQPETTFQVNVSNATYGVYSITSFTLSDTLTVDDFTIAAGDRFNVTGTTTRVNTTQIIVNVTGFNVDHGATPAAWNGQYNQSFWATTTDTTGDTPLEAVDYTITANDTITTATGTLTVETPRIDIVSPTEGAEIGIGTNVSVTGSTNRGDGETATISITGPIYALPATDTTIQDGAFTYYWNTSGLALSAGTYHITSQTTINAITYTDTITVDLISPGAPSITAFSPTETPTNAPGESRTFSVTVDQIVTVNWEMDGSVKQIDSSTTEASYTVTSAVEAVLNISAIASNTYGSDIQTWIWTVEEEAVVGTTGDININEIMYNPSSAIGPDADMEWVELYNNDTAAIDMSSWTLDGSAISPATTMQPGDYLVIAKNKTAFESYYTTVTCTIIDMSSLSLTNTEDTIVLKNSTEVEMDNVTYTSSLGADGNGKTLELNAAGGWVESTVDGGTPCAENSVVDDWNEWDDDGEITDTEISLAEYHWATNTLINGHLITDSEISLLEYQWATGSV